MRLSHSLLNLAVLLVVAFMLTPVAIVIGIAFGEGATYAFPPRGLSLRWFESLLSTSIFSNALFKVSLPLAITVALVSTALGGAAAIGLARLPHRWAKVVTLLFASPLIFPQILLGVALFLLYSRLNMSMSMATLAAGHVLIATPYVIRTVSAGLAGIDDRLAQAAQNLGASPRQAFFLVTVPLLKSALLSGGIFAFIVPFSDINLALFLSSAGTTTLPMEILAQMTYVSDPTIAAAAAAQILVVSVLVIVTQHLTGTARA